ncbi:hypothetical protein PHYPO_G00178990 [Pangasianodon hypophthalmus]|uniref:Uncharacterized protein n=1 Tax=Pangasianodon hypophthalmus TaxID=310915 RepID=A0A5N5PPZ2_PANHP|nr:hypothetical protein PHYPO_G00178990 [Pangasianodon hypophthalmus]
MGCQEAVNHRVNAHSVGVKGQDRGVEGLWVSLTRARGRCSPQCGILQCGSLLHTQHGCESDLSGSSGNGDYLWICFRRQAYQPGREVLVPFYSHHGPPEEHP